jgi:hypothetical protein
MGAHMGHKHNNMVRAGQTKSNDERLELPLPAVRQSGDRRYVANLAAADPEELGDTIERLIDLAFGELGARHLYVTVSTTLNERESRP